MSGGNYPDSNLYGSGCRTDLCLTVLVVFLPLQGSREAFFVANLEDVVKKHVCLLKALPRVTPVYPLKCNGSRGVVQMLAGLGAGFSCTNKVGWSGPGRRGGLQGAGKKVQRVSAAWTRMKPGAPTEEAPWLGNGVSPRKSKGRSPVVFSKKAPEGVFPFPSQAGPPELWNSPAADPPLCARKAKHV